MKSYSQSPHTRHRPNQSLAKHNRKPIQLTENKQQRRKSIASFCRVFRAYVTVFQAPRIRQRISRSTAHQSLMTLQESLASPTPSHGIIMLSNAQRASLIESPAARPATGSWRGRKPATASDHLIRSTDIAALILGTTKDNA